MGEYIWLQNFERDGRSAKVSFKALTEKRETKIAGRIGKKVPIKNLKIYLEEKKCHLKSLK